MPLARRRGARRNRRPPDVVGTDVGIDVLPGWLEALGLPPPTVLVAREPDDVPEHAERIWCVVGGPEGWDVYWAEDGQRWSWTRFDEEAAACFGLFGRLAWAQLMRGALGAAGGR